MTRLWHTVLAALIVFALVGQTGLVFTGEGRSLLNTYSYFTIQSNILVLIAALVIAVRPEPEGTGWAIFRLAGLVGITVTGLVYATILAGTADFTGIAWWYDKIFHYVAPVGAMLGFFLFRPRTRFARSDLVFVVWPVFWLGYTMIRAGVSTPNFAGPDNTLSYVPYDFLDIQKYGPGRVGINAFAITVLMLGIAALYVRFSNRSAAPAQPE